MFREASSPVKVVTRGGGVAGCTPCEARGGLFRSPVLRERCPEAVRSLDPLDEGDDSLAEGGGDGCLPPDPGPDGRALRRRETAAHGAPQGGSRRCPAGWAAPGRRPPDKDLAAD
ncbi:hypothetical protein SSP24_03840 [Streptomyces spinoverrucosus]|uniref:Uncharacterized protein n=1 Tax=Streptomyces spinoverrucosus TaxID=284043 RepID=A0A4Y3VAL5_9ACTN|nr:hypothetical protein SSP24_03840 [Streptomyces spinoverrucosus]GHB40883.1 hypothetical protein GCM10010397_08760 [Streptomyces spinoverrucosus]